MKSLLLILSVVLFFSFTSEKQDHNNYNLQTDNKVNLHCPAPPSFGQSIKSQTKKDDKDIDQDWYSKAMENIQKEEYNISYSEELNSYQSPNRKNNMRFIYHNDGFTAKNRENKIPLFDLNDKTIKEKDKKYETMDEWSIDFKMSDIKRVSSNERTSPSSLFQRGEQREVLLNKSELSVSGNKASIEDDNMRINYTNDKEGMRQDFIIKNKPDGEGKLRLNLLADTKLRLLVGVDALMFKDKRGEDKMKYSALKVFDANGKELRAYFEKNDQLQITNDKLRIKKNKSQIRNPEFQLGKNSKSEISNSNLFSIVVNDDRATYPITIDPLSATPNWTAESNQANAYFGNSVSTAGDVNGDGYSDVIVGASNYDNGQTDEGRAFVYQGSASGLSATASWTAESNQANAYFGYSVSTAGDVNGDGYSDVIVGAYNYDNGQIDEGRAIVYHGSASGLSAIANWTAEPNQANVFFGNSVSTAGDVNGDGYSDVIVGELYYHNGQSYEGAAFVYHGSASGLSATANWIAESNRDIAFFGNSVSTAGDVNGDGYSDVIIGAFTYDNGQGDEGWAFVYHGSASGLSATANWTGESNQNGARFGNSVSTAGDVNGDGYSDVIVGALYYDNGQTQTNEGRAFVYHGSASGLSPIPNWTGVCNEALALFGYSVSPAGDINGDGFSDVIVGARNYSNGQTNEGGAFVYHGSASGLLATANWTAESNQASAYFGYSVATTGDVNGDGYADVIVGAYAYDKIGIIDEGKTFVYHGSASGLSSIANWTAESDQNGANFGKSVSTAGDVNGDGYSDVIIGADEYDNGETNEGAAFVFYGSASGLLATANWTAEPNQANVFFGSSVSTAGDVNGDGYADVIIGAVGYSNGQTNEGGAFVYHGSASGLSSTANWTAESNQASAYFGVSVSTVGDVNGDGYADVIIGANQYDNGEINEGAAFVFYGSASGLSSTANWTAESNQAGADFGNSISTAGDLNGDGYSDVIIGARLYSNGQVWEGMAFVYLGSVLGLSSTANWTAESNQANSQFGVSVSTAGDVNGDGYSDVIVGQFSNSQVASVYLGSASGLSATANWTAGSGSSGSNVSTAGDVNGDGYSDVIIGEDLYSNGQDLEGGTFVYQGSALGLSATPNWQAESDQENARFGNSVSTAGDVNGDGYSDVIIGADGYDNAQFNEGRAFVYYGNVGTGLRSTVQQYKPSSNILVYSGGLSGTNGQARLNIFGKSPFGRADGKIVYEYKENGVPFSSGSVITNSVSSSGSGVYTDLGTSIGGVQLNSDISGLLLTKEYKWRARVQYNPVNNPLQKYGSWKYYTNYVPLPFGCTKAQVIPPAVKSMNLNVLMQGFYNAATDQMVGDTITVYLRTAFPPFNYADSSILKLNSSGAGAFLFNHAINNTPYYIQIKHRNSIETWSKTPQVFTASVLSYDFTPAANKAYGDNMIQINASPVRYAVFSGDVNQDWYIDLNDINLVFNDASSFLIGYVVSDVTGDNIVDLTDLTITFNNSSSFVKKVNP